MRRTFQAEGGRGIAHHGESIRPARGNDEWPEPWRIGPSWQRNEKKTYSRQRTASAQTDKGKLKLQSHVFLFPTPWAVILEAGLEFILCVVAVFLFPLICKKELLVQLLVSHIFTLLGCWSLYVLSPWHSYSQKRENVEIWDIITSSLA